MRHTLTADDVKAIRKGNDFVVTSDGEIALLSVTRQGRLDGVFATTEGRREIVCDLNSTQTGCFVMLYRPGNWQALGAIIRTGDRLLFAMRQNNNQYMDAAVIPAGTLDGHNGGYSSLHVDELLVTVQRTGANGKERTVVHEMVLDTSQTPNNSARPLHVVAPLAARTA